MHNFYSSNGKKKMQELIKMDTKLQKRDLTCYSLLIAQDLWKAHYQICRIRYKNCDYLFGYTNFKDDLIEYKCLYYNNN